MALNDDSCPVLLGTQTHEESAGQPLYRGGGPMPVSLRDLAALLLESISKRNLDMGGAR
eukprot:CAMPEP_0115537848 /NCGR_PEP_ID=MMETSP0271-20121206/88544_2 /TAXON_ID=71861 /ORGANISM="Scrippsiella trochoidea, Strain CCMP3099" /LENGTH=58 /DNA_ID=CAMNT_0002970665 /DNA_START=296 /DNA_END=468 /DNA_ORIENTATION=-